MARKETQLKNKAGQQVLPSHGNQDETNRENANSITELLIQIFADCAVWG